MKYAILTLSILILLAACNDEFALKNMTRPGGYAMGEQVQLKFELENSKGAPDSIDVFVLESKTKYEYALRAGRGNCNGSCEYDVIWDGRKTDGSWPAGGRYQVFAGIGERAFSDTVQIGLGD
jgi:hypothetical protein